MVCTFMSFLGLFILILCLKREEQKPGLESLPGPLPTPFTNRNGSASSVENPLKTNVEFSQRLDGAVPPFLQMLDGVDDDDDDKTSSREPPFSQVLERVEIDNETSSGGASIPQTLEEFIYAVDGDDDNDGDGDDTSSIGAPMDVDDETGGGVPIFQNETSSEEQGSISEDETSSEAAFVSQNETSSRGAAPIFISRNETESRTGTGPVSISQNEMNACISETKTNMSISQNETLIFQDEISPAAPPISQTVLLDPKEKETRNGAMRAPISQSTLDRVSDYNGTSSGASPAITQNKTSGVAAPIDADEDHKPSSGADDGGCNLFEGRWVYEPTAYPLYQAHQCPFLSDQVTCQRNGRPDYAYAGWKWEPRGCGNIPRLDGKVVLERWRGKRVVIVGDSLNRNQWESLACILYSVLPRGRAYVDMRTHDYKLFRAKNYKDYGCTVEFFWSPFLVLKEKKVVKLNTLPRFANKWRGAHIMIFNTGHWWTHRGKFKAWDFFEYKGGLMENMEVEKAYKVALKTWARWIDRNVDPNKTTVFFRSVSPVHKSGNQWCYNQTQPNSVEIYGDSFPRRLTEVVEKQLRHMKTPVKYLNITHLSRYRKDAHASVYTSRRGKLLTKEQQMHPKEHADCSHWCLPGLPDTWNVLMYMSTLLFQKEMTTKKTTPATARTMDEKMPKTF
ncbi:hypothetical protein ACLOJK_010499 [Asimina triloba]